jgi:hypothetical protein
MVGFMYFVIALQNIFSHFATCSEAGGKQEG